MFITLLLFCFKIIGLYTPKQILEDDLDGERLQGQDLRIEKQKFFYI